jgi:V8-like Glu-specific endopeptidase
MQRGMRHRPVQVNQVELMNNNVDTPEPSAADKVGLRDFIVDNFSRDELETLCFDLTKRLALAGYTERITLDRIGGNNLDIIAQRLIEYVDRRGLLQYLVDEVRQKRPITVRQPIGGQAGQSSPEDTLIEPAALLKLVEATKAVTLVSNSAGTGTGFLVARDLVMTNCHVIDSARMAAQSAFTFNSQRDVNGHPSQAQRINPRPGGEYVSSRVDDLDYAIVEVSGVPAEFAPLTLIPNGVSAGSRIVIVQHPLGEYKQISMQGTVVFADERLVRYESKTDHGSSGSPVLNWNAEVVALHHAGAAAPQSGSAGQPQLKEAINMTAILRHVRETRPDIYLRLQTK